MFIPLKIDFFLLVRQRCAGAAPEEGKTARRNQFCQTIVLAKLSKRTKKLRPKEANFFKSSKNLPRYPSKEAIF